MTEAPESNIAAAAPVEPARYETRSGTPSRLSQALMWVGIIAGVVFVVAVVFFSGFFLGWSSSGPYGTHHGGSGRMMGPGGMRPGGMMGPGGMRPGGMMGPGQQSPATTAPTTPRP